MFMHDQFEIVVEVAVEIFVVIIFAKSARRNLSSLQRRLKTYKLNAP